ncbi:probable signal peptidase complex subunit 2 isoform X1 [Lytechinus variegatus]|uniref:probable signal peptidase complex subunit 2 isoform X1 n=1 Tax=Lytechinus variegatus TaxID=7654 RepID=UPI001BB2666F|nr:probable signal peptidase complex subunit 2 isoform X1 [Lytechinus variegatus]
MSSERGDTLVRHMEEEPCKVDKWNGTAVKNALDDDIRRIFTKVFEYEENHSLIDNRLVLCSVACMFAIVALIYDYLNPFPESRSVLAFCVLAYFAMMSLLTLYTTMIEKNHFLVTNQKDPAGLDPSDTWCCDSYMKRFDDEYNLVLQFEDGKTKEKRESSITKSVGAWFDESGLLLHDRFQSDVCKLHNSLLAEKKDK